MAIAWPKYIYRYSVRSKASQQFCAMAVERPHETCAADFIGPRDDIVFRLGKMKAKWQPCADGFQLLYEFAMIRKIEVIACDGVSNIPAPVRPGRADKRVVRVEVYNQSAESPDRRDGIRQELNSLEDPNDIGPHGPALGKKPAVRATVDCWVVKTLPYAADERP
jgi:hypothetical protein